MNSPDTKMFWLDRQEIVLEDIPGSGWILDIGGGGEGIIGQLKGSQVVAIDRNRQELEEAAAGPLKLVMDAAHLHFLDNTFELATAFFTMMYVAQADQAQVFRELYRVLKPGGRLLVWDATIPARTEQEEAIVVVPLSIRLPGAVIETGYGRPWPDTELNAAHYVDMACTVGFDLIDQTAQSLVFYLELRKPA